MENKFRDKEIKNMNNKRNNRGSRGPVQDGGARYRDRDAFSPDFDENEEEYWEDEEDYEEFARSMDREYGYEDSRQSSARSGRTGRAQNSRSSSGGSRGRSGIGSRRRADRGIIIIQATKRHTALRGCPTGSPAEYDGEICT